MKPAISIIIPAHNEEKYIRQTLHNLKQQTFQNFEVITVCNGCTDKTEEVVKKKINEKINEQFKLFSMSQANVSRARNYGADKAQGDILLFLDADTLLETDALQKINNQFLPPYSVATTLTKYDAPELKYKLAAGFKNAYTYLNLYHGCSGALICRKDDFQKINGYDPEIIVKEHRKLILKLKKIGKFNCLNTSVITSARRFKEWGLTKSALYWTNQWIKNYVSDLKKSEYEKIR